jgi:hypothetical protein
MVQQARAEGLVKDFGLENLLRQLEDLRLSGTLQFFPGDREFYFERGDLIAARGGELLGSILLRLGAISLQQLHRALAEQGSRNLGEVLLSTGLYPQMLEDALHIQILRALVSLFEDVPHTFVFHNQPIALPIQTRLPVQVALSEVVPNLTDNQPETFTAQSVLRLLSYMPSQALQLEPEQWAVATLLDGRRTLDVVSKLYQIRFPRRDQPEKRTFAAAWQLFELGLVEVMQHHLEEILLRSRSGNQVAHLQQQFLVLADGQRTLFELGAYLGLGSAQTAEMAVELYRSRRLEVQRGLLAFERLLEYF